MCRHITRAKEEVRVPMLLGVAGLAAGMSIKAQRVSAGLLVAETDPGFLLGMVDLVEADTMLVSDKFVKEHIMRVQNKGHICRFGERNRF